eukprot:SAG22_NODE_1589_length_4048_cov_68.361611_4_plen_142_part_00
MSDSSEEPAPEKEPESEPMVEDAVLDESGKLCAVVGCNQTSKYISADMCIRHKNRLYKGKQFEMDDSEQIVQRNAKIKFQNISKASKKKFKKQRKYKRPNKADASGVVVQVTQIHDVQIKMSIERLTGTCRPITLTSVKRF